MGDGDPDAGPYRYVVTFNAARMADNLDDLLGGLRKASQMRNILCHGSWRLSDTSGASIPFFVNRQKEIVDSAMDRQCIDQVQRCTANLACAVINTVTQMGWQFPGSAGPGKTIWKLTAQQGNTPDAFVAGDF